jgi:nucleoside-diphosphate-sugar epimerase
MARLLIVGCGYVGAVLAERALRAGDAVFGVRRSDAPLPDGVEVIRADVSTPLATGCLPDGIDDVVYAVAAKSRDEAVYRSAYVDGLRNVIDALLRAPRPPRRLVFTSSTAVYGQHDGEWVDESSPTEPAGHRGAIMLEAEARLAASPIPALALRLGGLYGPGRTRLLDSLREGRAVLPRGVTRYTNRVHRDDAAGALRHLARLDAPPPLVLGVDDEPAERGEVLRWLADALGAPAPQEVDPGSGPHDRGKRCRNALLRSSGYEPRYPSFREGYAAQIASLRRADG